MLGYPPTPHPPRGARRLIARLHRTPLGVKPWLGAAPVTGPYPNCTVVPSINNNNEPCCAFI